MGAGAPAGLATAWGGQGTWRGRGHCLLSVFFERGCGPVWVWVWMCRVVENFKAKTALYLVPSCFVQRLARSKQVLVWGAASLVSLPLMNALVLQSGNAKLFAYAVYMRLC